MKLVKKITQKRRAISPIIGAILLIGLAITAGAVLFVVVIPMLTTSGGVSFDIATTTLSENTTHIVLKNDATDKATVVSVTITNGSTNAGFATTFAQFSINSGQGAIKDYTFSGSLVSGTHTITVEFYFGTDSANTAIVTLDLTT